MNRITDSEESRVLMRALISSLGAAGDAELGTVAVGALRYEGPIFSSKSLTSSPDPCRSQSISIIPSIRGDESQS